MHASQTAHPPLRTGAARLRVLLASDFHGKYVAWLARAMADHGAAVRLLTRDHDLEFGGGNGAAEAGAMARWTAATLGGRAEHLMLPGRVRDVAALPAAARITGRLRRFRPDVVHLQDAAAQDVRLPAVAGIRPGRFAVTVHDVVQHPGDRMRGSRTAAVRRQLIERAGLVFVHSEPLREQLLATYAPRGAVAVVPHGTTPPVRVPLARDPHVVFFGRISRYKGIGVLLDAMADVWGALPGARLTIAGAGELPDHPALADGRVTVRNEYVPEEELDALFAAARCVVLPYLEASQSGVGSRAKAFGRPLVVSDLGGLPDLVADGAGRVVPPGDAGALATALAEVLDPDGPAEAMQETAFASVSAISWDRVAERTLDAYHEHLPIVV